MERLTGNDRPESIVDILLKNGLPVPNIEKKPERRNEQLTCEACNVKFEAEVVTYHVKKPEAMSNYPGRIRMVDATWEYRPNLCPGCKAKKEAALIKEEQEEKRAEEFKARVERSNVPENTQMTYRFETFQPLQGKEKAFQLVREYAFEEPPKHPFLTMAGDTGRGKTHLALAVAWHYLENSDKSVRYYHAQDLLDMLRTGYDSDRNEEEKFTFSQRLASVKNCGLLIVDDLGAENSTPWARTMFDSVIDYRYIRQLRTVITLNVAPDALPERLSGRIQEGFVTVVKGVNYRTIKAKLLRGEQ